MSCSNFEFMKYGLPLIVAESSAEEAGYDEMKELYESDNDEEYTIDMYYDDINFDYDFLVEDMETLAKEINDTLQFYTVEVKSGYYRGLQFTVDSENDIDPEHPWFNNEDARYWFDECRSKVLRKAKSELNKIRKWLLNLKKHGYIELGCLGVFDNGEAVYSVVS